MKIKSYAKLLLLASVLGSIPLQAATDTSSIQTIAQPLYIDTSSFYLPFKQLENGYVCPIQVPGELLAAFSQARSDYDHQGIDIRAAEGTPIFAIADGVITKAAPDSKGVDQGGGHMIFVDYGNGVEGRYMHLSGYGVQAGDRVRAGQVIGFTGSTGDSTTPHLHFEYYINGILQDPTFLFEESGMILEKNINEWETNVVVKEENEIFMEVAHEPFFVVQQ